MNENHWPHGQIDVDELKRQGWHPTPFREFVFKVVQRCNLACDYCYVYTKVDQSWRHRPPMMAPDIWRMAAKRIAEHVDVHGLREIRVILHGGEPLLAGAQRLARIASDIREAVSGRCQVVVTVQTNGTLITPAILGTLREATIKVGISVDGRGETAWNHRRFPNGRSSFSLVDRAMRMLQEPHNVDVYSGVLCVVNTELDPVACYEDLLTYGPPSIDFLLPHANWSDAPVRRDRISFGRWLIEVFDRWYGAQRQETRVRIFENAINLVLGGSSDTENLGLSPVAVAVVESDGSIEQVDSLKSAYSGAPATGLSVIEHSFDDALLLPAFVARQAGLVTLSRECLACPVHRVCGAGHYAHRFHERTGFKNRSVYCSDLFELITHIVSRLSIDLRRLRETL